MHLFGPDLPSTLLLRRPDIKAAGMRVQSENATISGSTAAFFPQLNHNLLQRKPLSATLSKQLINKREEQLLIWLQ